MAEAALRRWVDSGRQRISTTPVPGSPWTMSIAGETIVRFSLDTTNSKFKNTGANECI